MKLDEVKKIVFQEKPVFGSIYNKYNDKKWTDYLGDRIPKKKELSEKNLELLEIFESLVEKILGRELALLGKNSLKENFFASTCDHHGVLCHPFFLNASLVRSKNEISKGNAVVVLSCGGVSTSNSSFPRGIFFHNEKMEDVRMPFVSLKHKMRPVYGLPALSRESFSRIFDRTISKSGEIVERKIEQLKDILLTNGKIFALKYYSDQCTLINNILWKEVFAGERGELVYIEMEVLVKNLLLEKHLGKKTEIEKIIFDRNIRERFIRNLEGVQGAHDTKNQKGSHLFWYIDKDKRRQLFLKVNKLTTLEGDICIDITKENIEKLLTERKIFPSMALCFSTLSFYHGLTCGGGFSQVGYLGEMYVAYKKTFSDRNFQDRMKTDIFTGEFILATFESKKEISGATLLDLFIYGEPALSKKIDSIIEKTKIGDTLDLMMPDFYKIITGKNININNMPKLTPTILSKNEKKCVHCGNNPTNHFRSYIFQTATVPFIPILRMMSVVDGPFAQGLAKVVLTPYLWMFQGLGIIKFNQDKNKAFTKRAEVIWVEAEKRGILMEQFVIWGKPMEQYRAKIGNAWKYFESLPLPDGGKATSYTWMDDKAILKKKLLKAGVPVAYGKSVSSIKTALEIFEKARKPVIVKPQLGSRGRHTTTHIYTKEELLKAYKVAKKLCHFVIVEEHLFGSVYRATYVGGEIVGILRGDPPRVKGDSLHTIKELIAIKNENKKDLVKDVLITDMLVEFIGRLGLTLDTILESGRTIDLSEKIGISYGGFSAEEFPTTHLKLLSYLKKAGDFLNAPVVGFDFIIEDAKADPDLQRWGIIEANSLPFINLHHFPLEGKPINVAGKVWDLWKK